MCLTRACSPGLGGSLSYCLETIWARGFGAVLASPWTTAQCASVLSASAPGPQGVAEESHSVVKWLLAQQMNDV